MLWLDCPITIRPKHALEIRTLVDKLQPECLINSRIGCGMQDFDSLGDNLFPVDGGETPVESAATLNDTWGYKSGDQNWKPFAEIRDTLIDLASRNTNLLLNFGPDGCGRIPAPALEVLDRLADWMKSASGAIHGAAGNPLPQELSWCRCTFSGGNRLNLFIRQMHECIHSVKPWVKFGVSPFGIYRNQKSDPVRGSRTNGLQNYDDLYADVLKWVDEGWVDYNIPQVYWEIGHPAADYETLVRWWSEHAGHRPLIIGQDVDRTVAKADPANPNRHQMERKMALQRTLPNIEGSCQWYAKAVVDNKGNYGTMLREYYHRHPALQPEMPWIDKKRPKKVRKLTTLWTEDGYMLFWREPKGKGEMDRACRYVVYRFEDGEPIDLNYAENIVAITPYTFYKLPYEDGSRKYTYVVTALDRLQNESKKVKEKVRL